MTANSTTNDVREPSFTNRFDLHESIGIKPLRFGLGFLLFTSCLVVACGSDPYELDEVPVSADGEGSAFPDERPDLIDELEEKGHPIFVPDDKASEVDGVLDQTSDQTSGWVETQDIRWAESPLTPVSATTRSPFASAVQLRVRWPDALDEFFLCSGTMVRADAVLTAAHCLYNPERGGFAYSVELTPARSGTVRPFGRTWGRRLFVSARFRQLSPGIRKLREDFGIVRLQTPLEVPTTRMYSKVNPTGASFSLLGYPLFRQDVLHQSADRVRRVFSDGVFWHRASTDSGMSGAGVLDRTGVFGVHAGANDVESDNDGILFSTTTLHVLTGWADKAL